jgi:hypothetical protein
VATPGAVVGRGLPEAAAPAATGSGDRFDHTQLDHSLNTLSFVVALGVRWRPFEETGRHGFPVTG